jgi:hypothetical protein
MIIIRWCRPEERFLDKLTVQAWLLLPNKHHVKDSIDSTEGIGGIACWEVRKKKPKQTYGINQ